MKKNDKNKNDGGKDESIKLKEKLKEEDKVLSKQLKTEVKEMEEKESFLKRLLGGLRK